MAEQQQKKSTPEAILDKISSRKFLVCVIAIFVNVYMLNAGTINAKLCMDNIIWLVGIFVIGEAFVDGKRVGNGGMSKPLKIAELVGKVVETVKKKDGER